VGFPVSIGGQKVETGDMVVADSSGVVVVPFDKLDEVIARLAEIKTLEAELDAKVEAGLKVPEAITELLQSDQVKFRD
jgi:4-hydroxy-4-methyl-2-oxoglutarate aldolase